MAHGTKPSLRVLQTALADAYASDLKRHFKIYYATWPPGDPVRLGDYGLLIGRVFARQDNIERLGVRLEVRRDLQRDVFEYKSSGSVSVKLGARTAPGQGPPIPNAEVTVSFSRDKAIFFQAADCRLDSIENLADVGRALSSLSVGGTWDRKSVVVTGVLAAGGTTVLISTGRRASITLQASQQIQNLASPGIDLQATSDTNIGLKVVAKDGLTPLIQLRRLRRQQLQPKTVRPAAVGTWWEAPGSRPRERRKLRRAR